MSARHGSSPASAPGPDLLARYLNAYLAARQLSDLERPWGLGDDSLDSLWSRLTEAVSTDPQRLNEIVAGHFTDADRLHIVETLAPLIFALPLRTYPAELRAVKSRTRLVLTLRHLEPHGPQKNERDESDSRKKPGEDEDPIEHIGHLPAALCATFAIYLRKLLQWTEEKTRSIVTISSGGRRRRVRITLLAQDRGVVIRFLERLPSPADEGA